MQRRQAHPFFFLLAFSLAAIALAKPACASDFEIRLVNRTGQDQVGVVVMLAGSVILQDAASEPFRQVRLLDEGWLPFITMVHYFNADGIARPIPSAPARQTPPQSVVTLSFTTATHQFVILGLCWVDANGRLTQIAL